MGSDVFEPLDATEEESEDKQAGDQQEEGCHDVHLGPVLDSVIS